MKNSLNQNCEDCSSKKRSIFCHVKDGDFYPLMKQKNSFALKKGRALICIGDKLNNLFCVKKGKLKFIKISSDGKENIINIAKPGDIIGHEIIANMQSKIEYSVVALEDAEICSIDRKIFFEIFSISPSVRISIIEKLSNQLHAVESRILSLKENTVKERLIKLLLSMQIEFGSQDSGWYKIDLRLTRMDLAMIVGSSCETIIRTIGELERENFIKYVGKTLYISEHHKHNQSLLSAASANSINTSFTIQ
ncbi:hypothetical protein DOM21_14945 [Bacteriovorax stolpii]|uniref:Crp/Fnr family transcriptional regulator n=1 Tax=Bacteriovorax stolpii TaxID=960 RepID=UPI00115B241A|nr:Crp/Fnr family transcriptional regulator [Bacteriovorax stolpii]QDK42724.1 hypothetical protein DOM21_14945 [Bacteriovorax stolpii]